MRRLFKKLHQELFGKDSEFLQGSKKRYITQTKGSHGNIGHMVHHLFSNNMDNKLNCQFCNSPQHLHKKEPTCEKCYYLLKMGG